MLQAKDLMIGDYVAYLPTWENEDDTIQREGNSNNPMICKVKGLNGAGAQLSKGTDYFYFWADNIELYPIPLTPEILEKNGWASKRDGSGDFIYMRENTPGYGSNDMTVTKNIIGNFQMIHGSFNGISVHYVHELQHALRLCGIDKEIII